MSAIQVRWLGPNLAEAVMTAATFECVKMCVEGNGRLRLGVLPRIVEDARETTEGVTARLAGTEILKFADFLRTVRNVLPYESRSAMLEAVMTLRQGPGLIDILGGLDEVTP